MTKRNLILWGLASTLCACGQQGGNFAGASAANSSAALPAATARPTDAEELERELAATARALSAHLPLRQAGPQGPVTVARIEARGTEMIQTIDVPADLDATEFEQFRAQLPARMCEDSQIRSLVLRGGSQTYVMRDSGGEEFTATIASCTAAAPTSPLPVPAPVP